MLEEIPTRFLKLNIKNGRNFLPTMTRFLFPIFILGISTLEFLQFITKRGYAEIDDVILNTMGVAIGFWVDRFLLKFLKFHATLN